MLIDPEVGVHVFEVKAVALDQIESLEAGGQLRIRYESNVRAINPVVQVRNAMFDIKDATVRAFAGEVRLPFKYWVVFPAIRRVSWVGRFGEDGFCPAEFLFAEALEASQMARRLGRSDWVHAKGPIRLCPLEQLQCVWRAFGDTSVLYCAPDERQQRRTSEGTLGEQFDEAAEAYKKLSEEQQRLSAMNWEGGPRLIRGVAGSGKTIVLANNLARCLERRLIAASEGLFGAQAPPPRLLAVCFNRSLAPFIAKKINLAFQQRTGRQAPEGTVEILSFNRLMWKLAEAGLWRYQIVDNAEGIVRALQYGTELEQIKQRNPERLKSLAYDAIYVDEGQDFLEEEFRLLKELCRAGDGVEPNLYVFYDDAQNVYGRSRPNWQSIGLNVRGGRSFVMTQCFRNTRPIVEAIFNVLYGTCAGSPAQVPTRGFGDISTLQEKGLIVNEGGFWRVKFAARSGMKPRVSLAASREEESKLLVKRLRWLIEEQQVRPEDILVLAYTGQRVRQLAQAIDAERLSGISGIQIAVHEKDQPLCQKDRLTISTVASAKGYDAYCVLLASANAFGADVRGRASFYVGCTRAVEYLEVFGYAKEGLVNELEIALER